MKKTIRMFGAAALCLSFLLGFTQCKDDNDAPDVPGITIDDGSGTMVPVRLSSFGGDPIQYDEKGRVECVGNYITINYSKGIMEFDDEVLNVKFNDKGYISELSGSWDEEDEDGRYKGSAKAKFSYNSDGNIVKIQLTSDETAWEDGEKYNYSETGSTECIWKSGNLEKVEDTSIEKEDGETDKYHTVTTYQYGDMLNKFYQTPMALSYSWQLDEMYVLAAVGLFGVGPEYLPVSGVEVDDDYTDNYRYTYYLNDNGSIATEYINYTRIDWGYEEITRSAFNAAPAHKVNLRSIFVKKGHHVRK